MVIRNRKYINNDDLAVRLLHRVVLRVPDSATNHWNLKIVGIFEETEKKKCPEKNFSEYSARRRCRYWDSNSGHIGGT